MNQPGYPPTSSYPPHMGHMMPGMGQQAEESRSKKKWPLDVGDQYMLRPDSRKKMMTLLHAKLQQEKTDMKLLPMKDYSQETEQVRAKQREMFSEMRSVFNQLNPGTENLLKRYNSRISERAKRAELEAQESLHLSDMQKLAAADVLAMERLRAPSQL